MDIDKFSAHLKRTQAACKLQNKKWSQSIIQVVSSKSSLLMLVFFIKVGFLLIQSFGHMFFFLLLTKKQQYCFKINIWALNHYRLFLNELSFSASKAINFKLTQPVTNSGCGDGKKSKLSVLEENGSSMAMCCLHLVACIELGTLPRWRLCCKGSSAWFLSSAWNSTEIFHHKNSFYHISKSLSLHY